MTLKPVRLPWLGALGLALMLLLGTVINGWLRENEAIAIWLEGIALVLIFIWDRIEGKEQHEETIKQLKASQEQVKATLLSTHAVISVERPWLVVTWASDSYNAGLFNFGCRNQGKTAAKVISVSARNRFVHSDKLELPPDYSFKVPTPDLNLIVATDSFPIQRGLNPDGLIFHNGRHDSIKSGEESFIYYGNVVYRDTLYPESAHEGLHETTFCFLYRPDTRKFVRSGPDDYNRFT